MRTNNNADAPRQGERPRVCCHQHRDTTAQLEGPTLAEIQYRKKKPKIEKKKLYARNQAHSPGNCTNSLNQSLMAQSAFFLNR